MTTITTSNTIGVDDGDILTSSPTVVSKTHTHTLESIVGVQYILSQKADTGHTHLIEELVGITSEIDKFISSNTNIVTQSQLSAVSSTKANIGHIHTLAEITGLDPDIQSLYKKPANGIPASDLALEVNAILSNVAGIAADVFVLNRDILTKSDTTHTHNISEISALSTELAAKYQKPNTGIPLVHLEQSIIAILDNSVVTTNAIPTIKTDITNLVTTKANISHNHSIDNVTELSQILSNKSDSIHIHSQASTSEPGFMSIIDKTKLDTIQTGATHNSTDAELRNRNTHIGVQSISTISDLQPLLDSKYTKPNNGIPISDLNQPLQELLATIGTNNGTPNQLSVAPNYVIDDTLWTNTDPLSPIQTPDWFKLTNGECDYTNTITFDNTASQYGTPKPAKTGDSFLISAWLYPRGGDVCNYDVYYGCIGFDINGNKTEQQVLTRSKSTVGPSKLEGIIKLSNPLTKAFIPCMILDMPLGIWPTGTARNGIHATGLYVIKASKTESILEHQIKETSAPLVSYIDFHKHTNGLIINGAASMRNNYGFPNSRFDVDSPPGYDGCFEFSGLSLNVHPSVVRIDPMAVYEMSVYIKTDSTAKAHIGFIAYDGDMNEIRPQHIASVAGSTTTLAAPLSIGDTTVELVSSTNWDNSSVYTNSCMAIYPYKANGGKVYQKTVEPYTRYVTGGKQWDTGSINGNVITLNSPFPYSIANPDGGIKGTWPIGTMVTNNYTTQHQFNYRLGNNYDVPSDWTRISKLVGGGIDTSGSNDVTYFPPGTQYIQMAIYANVGNNPTSMKATGFYFNRTALHRSDVIL